MTENIERKKNINPSNIMKNYKYIQCAFTILLAWTFIPTFSQENYKNEMEEKNISFFKTKDARKIGDLMLLYQRCTGGWPKNIDMTKPLTEDAQAKVIKNKGRKDDSTTDNNATNMQMYFLARLYQQTEDKRYQKAVRKGVGYLLRGQYANGGWPQFWPIMHGYQVHITYNDNAMLNTMKLLRAVAEKQTPFNGNIVSSKLRAKAGKAFNKGINCILKTQITVNGLSTVWCQQHDRETLAPAPARAFELASFCSDESAGLVKLLISLPNPNEHIRNAINGAMKWIDDHKITSYRYIHGKRADFDHLSKLVRDTTAKPIWSRYYDLKRGEPFVCDRDGIPRHYLSELGIDRRNGYKWYTQDPSELYQLYSRWATKYASGHENDYTLNSKGGNERNLFMMFRREAINPADFDIIVHPGDTLQKIIEQAPLDGHKLYKIFICKGTYHQKVIINRPNILLVGENRDSTLIYWAEKDSDRKPEYYKGEEVGPGVITLQPEANDCMISGLTVYNNYGSTIEKTTTHQMAIYGKATRTIIVNCNIWSDGNDALALWAPDSGMYYHADLYLRCPGVDFMCPRGWCYATRCHFYGNGKAMIWHDGRGEKNKKLVITDSYFDAKSPTLLGRYHHDSQFYLVLCKLSKNVLDSNIHYAYSDKVLDPCLGGFRVYYYGCQREGGHGDWLNDNLSQAKGSPEFFDITAKWTFNGKWDPEKKIQNMWKYIVYSNSGE